MKRKRILLFTVFFLISIFLLYVIGPKPATLQLNTTLPIIQISPEETEEYIKRNEAGIRNIKPDNESRIVWYDSLHKSKTRYCIVYLHGFSASPQEGDPVHRYIANRYGCNLLLPRLYAHGIEEKEPLLEFNEMQYLASAKEAIALAKNLGEKVILMGTSTGATLALYLASGNPDIEALVLYSPNVDLYDSKSFLLTQPWGLQIARAVMGSNYYSFTGPQGMEQYWTSKYRIEAIIRLKNLLQYTMTKETFAHIKQPVLVCYYYKSEKEQDDVVSIPAIIKMYDELGTPIALKRKVSLPGTGIHAMASGIWSHDIPSVEKETEKFMEDVLKMKSTNK